MTTRETIINELKKRGAARADDLAEPLHLTAMAVRQHLYQLQADGAVESVTEAMGRGRPAKKWQLTEKSDIYFPDAHRDLTLDLIDSVRSVLGEEALEQLIEHRSEKQLQSYADAMTDKTDTEERLKSLAASRTAEGYMADIEPSENGGFLFIESHCPICEAAKSCTGLCAKELDIFQKLMNEATVERTEHIVSGARRCAYKVTPKK
jgi:predicted ArsR family transcriptional regulator